MGPMDVARETWLLPEVLVHHSLPTVPRIEVSDQVSGTSKQKALGMGCGCGQLSASVQYGGQRVAHCPPQTTQEGRL